MHLFRFAIRSLSRRPAYTALTVLLLGLGVGAVATIFSLIDVAYLRPLPYPDEQRVIWISSLQPGPNGEQTGAGLAVAHIVLNRQNNRSFDAIEGAVPKTHTVVVGADPEPAVGLQVSAGLFTVLGAKPTQGRAFSSTDETSDNTIAIVSNEFWRNRLGRDPSVIGRVMNVDGVPRTIVGVMHEGFAPLLAPVDVYTPLALDGSQMQNTWRGIMGVGRIRPGSSLPAATSDLDRMNGQIAELMPSARGVHVKLTPIREILFGNDRGSLAVTLVAVLLLLVLAIANVANLGLSDALARRQSTMTRLALGATPASIAARRLGEGAVMAVVSTMLGLALAHLTLVVLRSTNPGFFQGYGALSADTRLTAVAIVIALVSTLIAFAPIAVAEARVSVTSLATAESRGVGSRRERLTRDLLLAAQVAIALVLLFGAALLGKNLRSMMQTQRGFESARLLAIKFSMPPRYNTSDLRNGYLQRLIEAVARVPGIGSVSAAQIAFSPGFTSKSTLAIQGASQGPGNGLIANIRHVMPKALEVMDIKVLSGRGFDITDREGGRPVALVSGSFARQYLPPDRAIGARLKRTAIPNAPWMEVVGIVGEVKDAGVSEDLGPTIYVPYRQDNQSTVFMTLLARVASDVPPTERSLKTAIWEVDRSQAISRIALVDDLAYDSAAAPRFRALVVALLGLAALVLVAGGIYALTLFNVLKRTREIGLRLALGAEPGSLVKGAIWNGLRPVAIGIAIGLAVAFPMVRLMQRLIDETFSANDLPVLLTVLSGLLASGALCALFPALRATRISPSVALRE